MMSVHSFWHHAEDNGDYTAVIEDDGTARSARTLLAASNQVAHGLRARGVAKGDAIAVVMDNHSVVLEVALAAAQIGVYITPINHHLTMAEVAFILQDCQAKVVICSESHAALTHGALSDSNISDAARFVVGQAAGFLNFNELKAQQPTTRPADRTGGFTMTYTSGTTGRPRGVRRPAFDIDPDVLATSFTGFLQMFGIKSGGVNLVVAPLYHTAVINWTLYNLHFGNTVVLMENWSSEGMLQRIERYQVTNSHLVPTHFIRLLQLPDAVRTKYDVSSFIHVVHGAAPCPEKIKRRMLDWMGLVVYEYYAATEGGGTLAPPDEWLLRPGTVGKAWPISTIRILDDEHQLLPPGEVGTVWIRMGEHTFEYHGDEAKTQAAWNAGFFTVGDAGYLDSDGYLFLCDRKADMIISGGVNIYPAEIEAVLIEHPAVVDCAAFGIPDDDWGEQVKGVVQLADVNEDTTAQAILEFCRVRLASYKCPKSIDFVDELPRDPNGKLYKRRLRDPYWAGRTRAI
jgi:long-chain acyl-CoA synthetase